MSTNCHSLSVSRYHDQKHLIDVYLTWTNLRMLKLAVLFLATYPLAAALVTSMEKIRDLAAGNDASLIDAIEKAIEAELEKVKDLTR